LNGADEIPRRFLFPTVNVHLPALFGSIFAPPFSLFDVRDALRTSLSLAPVDKLRAFGICARLASSDIVLVLARWEV
jgi:hypothetical protein